MLFAEPADPFLHQIKLQEILAGFMRCDGVDQHSAACTGFDRLRQGCSSIGPDDHFTIARQPMVAERDAAFIKRLPVQRAAVLYRNVDSKLLTGS